MAEALHHIASEPFFAGLTDAQCEHLAGCATVERYPPGVYLLQEHAPAERFYVLLDGHVVLKTHLPHGQVATLETLGAHDPLGWSWLVEPRKWHYDGQVLEPTSALGFDAACLRDAMECDHDLGFVLQRRIIEAMADRLQATRMQSLDLYRNPGRTR